MIIAVDVDGVIADLHEAWLTRYNRDYNDTLRPEDINQWDIEPFVKPECGNKIFSYLSLPDLYKDVKVVPGALEGVAQLRGNGYRVVFATSNVKGMTDPKWEWLEHHGFLDGKRRAHPDLFVAYDKNLVDAALLIDDKAENVDKWIEEKRRRAILFEAPYNKGALDHKHSAFWNWCGRAHNWEGVIRCVKHFYPF